MNNKTSWCDYLSLDSLLGKRKSSNVFEYENPPCLLKRLRSEEAYDANLMSLRPENQPLQSFEDRANFREDVL